MNAVLTSDISVIAVFLQGLFSFFSPCVLPLLPVYFGYLSGGTAERNTDGSLRFDRGKVLLNTLLFVLGISTAFFLLGLGASAAGSALIKQQKLITRIGGILMILFGLYQSGLLGEWGFLARERRLPFRIETMTASPVMAFVFALCGSHAQQCFNSGGGGAGERNGDDFVLHTGICDSVSFVRSVFGNPTESGEKA